MTQTPPHGYTQDKDAYLKRLRRIEGQVRGIHRMVEEDKYCIDVLTQISAIQSALKAVSLGLLDEHLSHCVVGAVEAAQESGDVTSVDGPRSCVSGVVVRLARYNRQQQRRVLLRRTPLRRRWALRGRLAGAGRGGRRRRRAAAAAGLPHRLPDRCGGLRRAHLSGPGRLRWPRQVRAARRPPWR